MTKREACRAALAALDTWEPYLRAHSGLPGPRANLELLQAVVDMGDEQRFRQWLAIDPTGAHPNTPDEFLMACGVVGLGRLVAEGRTDLCPELRRYASDRRWRIREAVAMALQRLGDAGFDRLLDEITGWADGEPYEQRAAIAAVCEPRFLRDRNNARAALALPATVTNSFIGRLERRRDDVLTLRQALGYCWSVAVAADPDDGKPAMERLLTIDDPDIRQLLRENLRKARLSRNHPEWTEHRMVALASRLPHSSSQS